jgi:hypothetical protein
MVSLSQPHEDQVTHKSDKRHGCEHRRVVLRESTDDEANEKYNIAANNEPPSTKQIAVRSTDHESDRNRDGVQRDIPSCSGRVAELGCNHGSASTERGDDPEADTVRKSQDLSIL